MRNDLNKISNNATNGETIIQLIVFIAGDEEFGVPISSVREIIRMGQVTSMPNLPAYIKGIINVRGEIVTAIDVKARFSLLSSSVNDSKHIIVTQQEEGLFGLIVDEVIEVLRIKMNEIKPPPSLVSKIHKKYISGVVTHADRLIILLDLVRLLSHEDLVKYSQLDKKNKKQNNIDINNHVINTKLENKGQD